MKKSIRLIAVAVLMMMVVACKKDKTEEVVVITQKLLESVSSDEGVTTYHYNDRDQIDKIIFDSNDGEEKYIEEYTYNAEDQITHCTLTHNGRLVKNYELTYLGIQVDVYYTYYNSDSEERETEQKYFMRFFVGQDLDIWSHYITNSFGGTLRLNECTFSKNNMESFIYEKLDGTRICRYDFQYDHKRNPLIIGQNKYFNVFSLFRNVQFFKRSTIPTNNYIGGGSFEHNLTSVIKSDDGNHEEYTFDYRYDELGYPTSVDYSYSNEAAPESNINKQKLEFHYKK